MRPIRIFAIVGVLALVAAACSKTAAPNSSATTPTASASVSQAGATLGTTRTTLGTFLVGPGGKSLYLFEADTTSKSTCSTACAQTWPPLITTGAPIAGRGVRQSLLSTTQRSDGTMQVTYDGHPLYLYAGDTMAGDTAGEGLNSFGAGWDVVSPTGKKIEKPGG